MGRGEASRPHDRPRVRVVHAPERSRDRVRGRARTRAVRREHARRGRAGSARSVRRRGGRGMETPIRGAPADPRRVGGGRRGDRAHEMRPGRRRDARDRHRRGARARRGNGARARARDPRIRRDRRGSRPTRRRARRAPGVGARARTRAYPAVRRPRLHDQGGGDGRDRHAHGRLPERIAERRGLPGGASRARPRPADPQARRVAGLSGDEGGRQPHRRRTPRPGPRGCPRRARSVAPHDRLRRRDPARAGPRSDPGARRVQGLRRRRRGGCEDPVPRRAVRARTHSPTARARRVRSVRGARIGPAADGRRRHRPGRGAATRRGRTTPVVPGAARGGGP